MNFPEKELSVILYYGLLRIRESAANDDCEMCYLEADHLHNIPAILREKSIQLLRYYSEIEKPAYIKKATTQPIIIDVWQSWSIIDQFLSEQKKAEKGVRFCLL